MSEKNNKFRAEELEDNPLDEECLRYECEQAFLRLRYESPSVEDEWKKFSVAHSWMERRRLRWLASVSVVVAASLLAAVFLWVKEGEVAVSGRRMEVLVQDGQEERALVIDEDNGHFQVEHPLPASPQKRIEREGVVWSDTEADYSGAGKETKERRNIVAIPHGRFYKLKLSDGTEVWLNTASRLSFPTRFSGSKRIVTLEGEAYFKVSHDERHPFVVQANGVTTEVLGTEFNIKAYRHSDTNITLVRGSVRVSQHGKTREALLSPGDNVVCSDDGLQVSRVDIDYYTQWMEGYFYYDNVPLADILTDLGRWYNQTIEMEQDAWLMQQRLHFVAERSETIDHVIENLNAYRYLSVTREGSHKVVVHRRK